MALEGFNGTSELTVITALLHVKILDIRYAKRITFMNKIKEGGKRPCSTKRPSL